MESLTKLTDFSVEILNLPYFESMSIDEYRAKLGSYLSSEIKKSVDVMQINHGTSRPQDIVAIHFGSKHFSQYRLLIEINDLANKGAAVRSR